MAWFSKRLSFKKMPGTPKNCLNFAVDGLSSTHVFLEIVAALKSNFDAVVEKEIGSVMYDQWVMVLRVRSEVVAVSWAWHGIYISVDKKRAHRLLNEICEDLSELKFNKLRLIFEEKMG